ncbi:MAG: hypothetical protein ACREMU_03450 [Gemmatimonadaceae bacterium]
MIDASPLGYVRDSPSLLYGSIVAVLAAACLCSCAIGPTDCGGVSEPDVILTATASLTGALASNGATLLIYDVLHGGARVDSVTSRSDDEIVSGLSDHPGTFTVVVRRTSS